MFSFSLSKYFPNSYWLYPLSCFLASFFFFPLLHFYCLFSLIILSILSPFSLLPSYSLTRSHCKAGLELTIFLPQSLEVQVDTTHGSLPVSVSTPSPVSIAFHICVFIFHRDAHKPLTSNDLHFFSLPCFLHCFSCWQESSSSICSSPISHLNS